MDFKYLIRTLKRYSCAYSFSGLNKSERTARWTARSPKHTKRCDVVRKFRAFIRALVFGRHSQRMEQTTRENEK